MRIDEYQRIHSLEDTHWWYRSLHALARLHVARARIASPVLLDVGCGTGGFMSGLGSDLHRYGVDMHPEALRFARSRPGLSVCRATAERLPFPDARFDIVVSLDVICHAAVAAPGAAVAEMARVLKPDGLLVLNLPAYDWLRSGHDVAVHTARRFTRNQVRRMLEDAALQPVVLTHWNTLLFPAALAVRLLHRKRQESDLDAPAPWLNRGLHAVVGLERTLLRYVPLPFGLSILAAARKRA